VSKMYEVIVEVKVAGGMISGRVEDSGPGHSFFLPKGNCCGARAGFRVYSDHEDSGLDPRVKRLGEIETHLEGARDNLRALGRRLPPLRQLLTYEALDDGRFGIVVEGNRFESINLDEALTLAKNAYRGKLDRLCDLG
jgi:hypothetical protein